MSDSLILATDQPFVGGWAVFIFQGEKAHYWESLGDNAYEALCGYKGFTSDKFPALTKAAIGAMPYCKKCLKRRNKR